jgi:PHD/YefM family antitoxin component YafN of YafNO toxin-antitoxin module
VVLWSREEYEEQQEKALAILSKNHSQQLMSSIGW